MSDSPTENTIFILADKFIALANELSAKEKDISKVGTAMRFAAARYNAFEASVKSSNLVAEKENALEWFSQQYKDMLSENLDEHIQNPPFESLQKEIEAAEAKGDDAVKIFKN